MFYQTPSHPWREPDRAAEVQTRADTCSHVGCVGGAMVCGVVEKEVPKGGQAARGKRGRAAGSSCVQ